MNRCRNPDHPHCTVWVMPGEAVCAHGHPQPDGTAGRVGAVAASAGTGPAGLPSLPAFPGAQPIVAPALRARPHLHLSGFDPRAAGGRQAVKLEVRGMPADAGAELTLVLTSGLALRGGTSHVLARTRHGGWRPVFIEFSSRGVEHGQHRIEVELHSRQDAGAVLRRWACTLVILLPPPGATLGEIHRAFLATHKNVKVSADDGSIARVHGPGGGRMDIEVSARDASIVQLNLVPEQGRIDVGYAAIAWDEDLVELDAPVQAALHPCPASSACLVSDGGGALPRHVRLFALDEFVLGRHETADPQADLLLAHFSPDGPEPGGLTRRLSARHAIVRRGRDGFEIEDVSRFGLLIDGAWPGKHMAVPLRAGMQIELTASIRGVAVLRVAAVQPHAVVLQRADHGAAAECFYLIEPGRHPGDELSAGGGTRQAVAMPLLFHRDGGFWHLDLASGCETALVPDIAAFAGAVRFTAGAYPEWWTQRASDRRRLPEHTKPNP
jgi:hypothetical protein